MGDARHEPPPAGREADADPVAATDRTSQPRHFAAITRPTRWHRTTLTLLSLILTIVSWPITNTWPVPTINISPRAGLDPSWQAGLAMAFSNHLEWGSHINFTYGPLGFLTVPTLYYASTALLSLAYLLLSHLVLFALLLRAARTKLPAAWSFIVVYVVGASAVALVDPADLLMGCALLIAGFALSSPAEWPLSSTVPALAVLAGGSLFVKFSVGLFTISLTIIVAARTSCWKRDALLAIGAFVLSIGLIWTATGNSLGDLPLYLRMSAALAAGYAGAMSSESGGGISWCGAVIVLISFFYSLGLALRPTTRRPRICTWLAFLLFAWIALKEGFVRHDDLHDVDFFGLMMIAIIAGPWTRSHVPSGSVRMLPAARVNLGLLGLTVLLGCEVAGFVVPDPARTASNVHGLASQVTTLLSPSRRVQTIQLARLTLQAAYNLPASFVQQLRGQTVAVEPWENTVAWSIPGVRWDPEPILQEYSAYQSSLDQLDASFLRSRAAPTRILVQPLLQDEDIFQDPFLGAPSATVALMCRYDQAAVTSSWQLLQRVTNRCGQLRVIRTVTASFGQAIPVPQAGPRQAVIATFAGVGASLVYRLENLVLKAAPIHMDTPFATYRFIAGTAGDLHILRLPSTLGYSTPYSPPTLSSFSLIERDVLSAHLRYRVTFYAMTVT